MKTGARARRRGQLSATPEAEPLPSPAQLRERLLDLAYDASSYLRHSARPVIRISAALLVAGSLAACSGDTEPAPPAEAPPATVQPLAQEVRSGLPTTPGRYSVVPASLARDARGVYHFEWIDPATNEPRPATVSRVRLAEANAYTLEMPPDQGDPTLHIERNAQIALLQTGEAPSRTYSPGFFPLFWYPFFVGGGFGGGYRGAGYYDPPRTVPSSGRVEGSTSSTSPRPLPERTYGVSTAVAGRAGGTGGGVAASRRAGVDTDTSPTGGKSGVSAPRSGGFSSGSGSSSGSASS